MSQTRPQSVSAQADSLLSCFTEALPPFQPSVLPSIPARWLRYAGKTVNASAETPGFAVTCPRHRSCITWAGTAIVDCHLGESIVGSTAPSSPSARTPQLEKFEEYQRNKSPYGEAFTYQAWLTAVGEAQLYGTREPQIVCQPFDSCSDNRPRPSCSQSHTHFSFQVVLTEGPAANPTQLPRPSLPDAAADHEWQVAVLYHAQPPYLQCS